MQNRLDTIRAFLTENKIAFREPRVGRLIFEPLGTFPLTIDLINRLEDEGLHIKTHGHDSVLVSDAAGTFETVFREEANTTSPVSSLPKKPLEIHVWPTPIYEPKRSDTVICALNITTQMGNEFPISTRRRVCYAIAKAYPKCHPIIKAASQLQTRPTPCEQPAEAIQ